MTRNASVLIGVDGGATKVYARHAHRGGHDGSPAYRLGTADSKSILPRVPTFKPIDTAIQLEQRDEVPMSRPPAEIEQAGVVVTAIANCVTEVARRTNAKQILLGIGMPGLKTNDRRGIAVSNNGPRIPDLAEQLEQTLNRMGVELAEPIRAIGSDADHCGIGEQHAAKGLFRDVDHAYYLGGGTGIADAMKLGGRLVPFDAASRWIAKAWQFNTVLGPTFERLASARGINDQYAAAHDDRPRNAPEYPPYPEARAAAGDRSARTVVETAAIVLAELIFERLDTICHGRRRMPHRGAGYDQLDPHHIYRGAVLERIILGQRIGRIYANRAYARCFRAKLNRAMVEHIRSAGGKQLERRCLDGDRLRAGFVVPSRLPAAAALGAAIEADLIASAARGGC